MFFLLTAACSNNLSISALDGLSFILEVLNNGVEADDDILDDNDIVDTKLKKHVSTFWPSAYLTTNS